MNRRVFRKRFRIWKQHGQRRIICTTSWTAAVRFVSSERFTEARPWCREWFGHLLDQITARCVGFTSRFTGRATAADALMVLLEDEVSKFCCRVASSRIWENKTSLQVCVCVCVCVSVCAGVGTPRAPRFKRLYAIYHWSELLRELDALPHATTRK